MHVYLMKALNVLKSSGLLTKTLYTRIKQNSSSIFHIRAASLGAYLKVGPESTPVEKYTRLVEQNDACSSGG